MDTRTFLKSLGVISIATLPSMRAFAEHYADLPPAAAATDEDFWLAVRGGYRLKTEYINLENGYYCFMPEFILNRYLDHLREINRQGSYYLRTVQFENKKRSANLLAELMGAPADEVAITRNTTESLDLVIGGLDWKPGDEAIMVEQDYPAILNMFKQVSKRYGMVNRVLSMPLHPASDEEIVNLYASAITPKTKLIMICHMINITGHILPVQKICDMAHSRGVEVMVDAAHTVAHIDFKIPDLHCDYFGASLHKWLSVPLGSGILWVKKEKISKLWPLLASSNETPDDINRLNHTGTIPVHTDLAVVDAIEYYRMIGAERKEARLRFLQRYWSDQLRGLPRINLNTPEEKQRSCGIANVGVEGMKPSELADTLLKKYRIYTVAIDGAGVQGCRITPNIYTTPAELDRFVAAMKEIAKS